MEFPSRVIQNLLVFSSCSLMNDLLHDHLHHAWCCCSSCPWCKIRYVEQYTKRVLMKANGDVWCRTTDDDLEWVTSYKVRSLAECILEMSAIHEFLYGEIVRNLGITEKFLSPKSEVNVSCSIYSCQPLVPITQYNEEIRLVWLMPFLLFDTTIAMWRNVECGWNITVLVWMLYRKGLIYNEGCTTLSYETICHVQIRFLWQNSAMVCNRRNQPILSP